MTVPYWILSSYILTILISYPILRRDAINFYKQFPPEELDSLSPEALAGFISIMPGFNIYMVIICFIDRKNKT